MDRFPQLREIDYVKARAVALSCVHDHFPPESLPGWVNAALFYEEKVNYIVSMFQDSREYNWHKKRQDYYVDLIYELGFPQLLSDSSGFVNLSMDNINSDWDEQEFEYYLSELDIFTGETEVDEDEEDEEDREIEDERCDSP